MIYVLDSNTIIARLNGDARVTERLGALAPLGQVDDHARYARAIFFDAAVGSWMVPLSRVHCGVHRVFGDLLPCRQPNRGVRRRLLGAGIERG